MEYLGDIRVLVDLCLKVLFQYELFYRLIRKNNFEVVSYPTIISSFVPRYQWLWSDSLLHVEGLLYDLSMLLYIVETTCTSESMNPRPCFLSLQYRLRSLLSLVTLLFLYFQITDTHIYHPYCTCITISSPNQCTYTIYHCIGCVGDTRDSLLFGCSVA